MKVAASRLAQGSTTKTQSSAHQASSVNMKLSIDRYKGGLTSNEEAENRIGKKLVIASDEYRYGDEKVERPDYSVECIPLSQEDGSFRKTELSSRYYDRSGVTKICILNVRNSNGNLVGSFEVTEVGEELWNLFDGWRYVLRRTG